MASCTAVLMTENEKKLGAVKVPETVFVISHLGEFYVRTEKGARLSGGGIGVVFMPTDVYVRDKLGPA